VKIRALDVDTRLKEFTTGPAHDVTDRLFVVRRMFRLNDTFPEETTPTPRWLWERGGWLLVHRVTGRVTQINLPEFDPFYSTARAGVGTTSRMAVSRMTARNCSRSRHSLGDGRRFLRSRWESPMATRCRIPSVRRQHGRGNRRR